jgi:putative glycosyltransferase (TIGR04348 family)
VAQYPGNPSGRCCKRVKFRENLGDFHAFALPMSRPRIVIACPTTAASNNGNWHTASRWADMLSGPFEVQILTPSPQAPVQADAMIALHARRSAATVQAWAETGKPCAVVLTGTDLYRDIQTDLDAQRSLALARWLVVLQDHGFDALPAPWHDKTRVICQSAPRLPQLAKPQRPFKVCMVGHLRQEKDPLTFIQAAQLLANREHIEFHHYGEILDPAFIAPMAAAGWRNERYHWHGPVAHDAARAALQQAHVSVICSHMEGGAHVVIESVMAGTPVLASRISGNLGLLGADYQGCFETGDAPALARLIERSWTDPGWLHGLSAQCQTRAPLFEPRAEQQAVCDLAHALCHPEPPPAHAQG